MNKKQLTKGQSVSVTSKVEKKNDTLMDGEYSKKGISGSSRLLTTQAIPKSSSHRQRQNITVEPHATTPVTPPTTTLFIAG